MIEIREVNGRYEVYSPGRHWEVFRAKLAAQAAALGLAAKIKEELGRQPPIIAPWPVYPTVGLRRDSTHPYDSFPSCTAIVGRQLCSSSSKSFAAPQIATAYRVSDPLKSNEKRTRTRGDRIG